MTPEILKPTQSPIQTPAISDGHFEVLTEAQIAKLTAERREQLESIKSKISLKRYYAIEEKITEQEKALKEILDWQEGKSTHLSKYSLILDPHYFEQEFLN